MIAAFFLSGLFGQWFNSDADTQKNISAEDTSIKDVSTKAFLDEHGLGDTSMEANMAEIEVASLDDVLPPDSLTSPESYMMRREFEHRLKLRRLILYAIIVPMAIIPIWLMVLLTVPVFNKKSGPSEAMQMAYLTAVASDFIGLYYIITRDLFPDGKREKKRKLKNDS